MQFDLSKTFGNGKYYYLKSNHILFLSTPMKDNLVFDFSCL